MHRSWFLHDGERRGHDRCQLALGAQHGRYDNCYTGNDWNKTLCSDSKTCASKCALDGADYKATYGAEASGNSLSLTFVTEGTYGERPDLPVPEDYLFAVPMLTRAIAKPLTSDLVSILWLAKASTPCLRSSETSSPSTWMSPTLGKPWPPFQIEVFGDESEFSLATS